MLKKTITFEDFNGQKVTEDFYFNLNKAELVEMELGEKKGYGEYLKEIVAAEDRQKIVETFKTLILKSVGRRSEDGRRFVKNEDIRADFEHTNAFSELFVELATNHEAAVEFISAIVPATLAEDMKKVETTPELPTTSPQLEGQNEPDKVWTDFTREQLLEMSQHEFEAVAGNKPQEMPHDLLVIAMQRKNA